MSPILIALLGVFIVPVIVATWRMSLLGLAGQGFLMALVAYRLEPSPSTAAEWLTLADLGLVRGFAVPAMFYLVLRRREDPPRSLLVPSSLFSWAVGFGLVLVAFTFAELLVPQQGDQQVLIAVAAAGVMLGFLVLAVQPRPFGQMVGALRVENAIALVELGGGHHDEVPALQVTMLVLLIATALLFRWYLVTIPAELPPASEEVPTL